MKTKKLATWWKAGFVLILALAVVNLVTYSLGGGGVRVKGSQASIDRNADHQYFKINDQYAFDYSPKHQSIDFVSYKKASGLNSLFGEYERDASIFLQPSQDGDWVYNASPGFVEPGRVIAVNVASNETITKEEPISEDLNFFPDNLASKGLSKDTTREIWESDLLSLEELAVAKESAITLFLGIMAVLVLWIVILPFAFKKIETHQ